MVGIAVLSLRFGGDGTLGFSIWMSQRISTGEQLVKRHQVTAQPLQRIGVGMVALVLVL